MSDQQPPPPPEYRPSEPDPVVVPPPLEQPAPRPKQRSGWWYFGAAALTTVVVIAAVAGFVAFQRGKFGPRMATASALPPSTALYVSMDLEGVGRLDRILEAFDAAAAEAGLEPGTDALDLLDETVLAELGLDHTDFEAWIGRDVGIAMLDLDFAGLVAGVDGGELPPVPKLVVAASVRDRAEADAFIPRMVDAIEHQSGVTMTEDSYAGVQLWRGEAALPEAGLEGELVMGRSGDLMLLASGMAAMRDAIDAQDGEALRDSETFEQVVSELPDDRAITLYVGPELLRSFTDLALDPALAGPGVDLGEIEDSLDRFVGAGASLTLTDAGARIDFVQLARPGEEGSLPTNLVVGSGSEEIPSRLPAETVGYFAIGPWDLAGAFEAIIEAAEAAGAASQLAEFEQATGLDIENDVVNALTGEIGVGVFETDRGAIVASGGPPIGITILAGLTGPDAFRSTLDRLTSLLRETGLDVAEESAASGVLYTVAVPDAGESVYYGTWDDFFIGTTERDFAGGEKLDDTELFGEMTDALDGVPLAYVDVGAVLGLAGASPEIRRDLAPLRAVGAGGEATDTLSHFTLVALIDYGDE